MRNLCRMLTMALCTALLAAGTLTFADADARSVTYDLNIPYEDLTDALQSFAIASHHKLLYKAELTAGKTSRALKGHFTAEEAIQALLSGTGLIYEITGGSVVLIKSQDDKTSTIAPTATAGSRQSTAQSASSASSDEATSSKEAGKKSSQDFRVAQVDQANAGPQAVGEDQNAEKKKKDEQISEIVVTGTHIRGQAPIGSKLTVITGEDIEKFGFATAQDAVRWLPQNFGGLISDNVPSPLAQNDLRGAGANSSAANALNLRGLGADSTLVLINGRRLSPSGTLASFADVSMIPVSAIDHVEVLADGASAMYGSDAIGGVVNYVLRRDFEGATTSLHGGNAQGGLTDVEASQLLGTNWSSGYALVDLEFYNRNSLPASARAETTSDLRPFGGLNFSTNQCNPGTLQSGATTYAIPANQNGRSLTPPALTAGTQNFCDTLSNSTLYPSQLRWSVFGTAGQEVSDRVSLFADTLFTHRRVSSFSRNPQTLVVPDTNAFYVNPVGNSQPVEVAYDLSPDLGRVTTIDEVNQLNVTFGGRIKLAGDWILNADVGIARGTEHQGTNLGADPSLLAAALADSNPATAFNPFGDGSNTAPSTLAALRGTLSDTYTSMSTLRTAGIAADGSLLKLPGGAIRLAVGGEYRQQQFENDLVQIAKSSPSPSEIPFSATRHVDAAYLEALVPIFGENNAISGVKRLELSLAGRYEHYSDFGSASVPRVGINWVPLKALTVRAAWSKAFKAPNLPDLSEAQNYSYITQVADPRSSTGFSNVLLWGGGNRDLTAETAKVWTSGFDFVFDAPQPVTFSATYFNIAFTDRIGNIPSANYLLDSADAAAVIVNPNQQQRASACARSTFFGDLSGNGGSCLSAPIYALIDLRTRNESDVRESGFDVAASYAVPSTIGRFDFGFTGTYLFHYTQQLSPTAANTVVLNTPLNPVSLKMRGWAGTSKGGASVTLIANYIGDYNDTTSTPTRAISSWTTVDLSVVYDLGRVARATSGIQLTLTGQNLFDRSAPFYNNPAGVAYDPANASILGRYVAIGVRKSW
jgi:iron complex outermembrane receptor protein